MGRASLLRTGMLLAALGGAAVGAARADDAFYSDAKVTPVIEQALADLPGKVVSMAVVEYPPGGRTDSHRHAGSHTLVYVLDGELEFQVTGKPVVTLKAGQPFYEAPTDIHAVSRNASRTAPAKFLVVFVKDAGSPVLEPAH